MPLGYCPAILQSLRDLADPNAPSQKITPAGALYAVNDPQTRVGVPLQIGTDTGHLLGADGSDNPMFTGVDTLGRPSVNVKYYAPNQATVQSTKDCTSNGTPVMSETPFTLTFYKQKTITFTLQRLARLCEEATKIARLGVGNSVQKWGLNTPLMNEVALVIEGEMRNLVAAINIDIWTRLVASIGTSAGNISGGVPVATTKAVTLLEANGSLALNGYQVMDNDRLLNETVGKPMLIGGSLVNNFVRLMKWGCCNNDGVDWSKVFAEAPFIPYYDNYADTALGAGQFLVVEPGAVQFVKHNFYKGIFGQKHGVSEYGTYIDRRLPGIEFDLEVRAANCPIPSLDVVISLYYDVFARPAAFAAGDPLTGNRGIYRYTAVQTPAA
jgi:hypothetical protein